MYSKFLGFSAEVRAKKQSVGLRWQSIYLPEPRNPKTLESNPLVHGVIRVSRRGSADLATLSEFLIIAGNAEARFKSNTWRGRAIEPGKNPSSYFTGQTDSEFLALTRGVTANVLTHQLRYN